MPSLYFLALVVIIRRRIAYWELLRMVGGPFWRFAAAQGFKHTARPSMLCVRAAREIGPLSFRYMSLGNGWDTHRQRALIDTIFKCRWGNMLEPQELICSQKSGHNERHTMRFPRFKVFCNSL